MSPYKVREFSSYDPISNGDNTPRKTDIEIICIFNAYLPAQFIFDAYLYHR